MKKFLVLVILSLTLGTTLVAQIPENIKRHYTNSFDVFTILSTNKPEYFNPRAINQSFRLSASYVIPFGQSNFSFSIGAGIAFHNYYIDALPKDVLPEALQLEGRDDFYFIKIDSISDSKMSYKRSKMTLTYIDIPLEFRYVGDKGFKVSMGVKIDFLLNSYFKYNGTDFLYGTEENIKIRKYNLDNISSFQIGPIVRVGWKWINAFATYSITPVYDTGAGSKLNPICVGISFTPEY
ncbi:PorT family protein [Bacteroidales bacterium OttesenSCG-928-L14]|nr:PorT family protein [Bacteroidales bacterium OttesenSCG-928-L14]